jgi:hypothetical protein
LTSDPKLATMKTKNTDGNVILAFVGKDKPNVEIYKTEGGSVANETGSQIAWNPNEEYYVGHDNSGKNVPGKISSTTTLGHEFGHAYLVNFDPEHNSILEAIDTKNQYLDGKNGLSDPAEHTFIQRLEAKIAKSRGEGQRYFNRFLQPKEKAEKFLNNPENKNKKYYGDYRIR